MVEFTLTAPLLILVLVGMVELGNALNSYLTVVTSARDAARLYSKGSGSEAAMLNLVAVETARLPNPPPTGAEVCGGNPGVCMTEVGSGLGSGHKISVQVCYDHPVILGLPIIFPGPIRMCSTTVMRVAI